MTIDISTLDAAELDALIAEAAQRRSQMAEPWPGERPEATTAILNPPWYVSPTAEGTLLQIGYPGLGWLSFLIPPTERSILLGLLLQQTLAYLNDAAAAEIRATATAKPGGATPVAPASSAPAGGGGSVH